MRRNTPWTPWLPVNVTQGGARQEQRFRFTCRAPLPDPHGLQFGRRRMETRTCPADGSGTCDTDGTVRRPQHPPPSPPPAPPGPERWGKGGGGRERELRLRATQGSEEAPVTEASPPTPSAGGGAPAQRGHRPAHGERGLGSLGPVVVLLPGL